MEIVAYKGWQRNVRLANKHIELIATLDVGPRIIHLAVPGGKNVMKNYPGMGCNTELFTNADMLEVESLGPLVALAPGKKVEHVEDWYLLAGVPPIANEAAVDKHVRPLLRKSR